MNDDSLKDRVSIIEESLISALLAFPEAITEVMGDLYPSHFANARFMRTYETIVALTSRGVAVSPTSVGHAMRESGYLDTSEDEMFLHEMWGNSGSAANAAWCGDQIREGWHMRETVKALRNALTVLLACDANRSEIMDRLQSDLAKIAKLSAPLGPRAMGSDLAETYLRATDVEARSTTARGVSTGFPRLDWWTSGFQPSNLIVLAAQTGMGKTSFAMNIAAEVARAQNGVVVIFSMEMGRHELADRLAAAEAGVNLRSLVGGQLGRAELARLEASQETTAKLGEHLLLHVAGQVTTASIRSYLRRISLKQKIALVVVDYLQLCGTAEKAESLYVKTSKISGDLKAIAVDFDIPVLALSQLSREAMRRGGLPRLSDLRDSGTIEQDANVVIFIDRDRRDSNEEAPSSATIVIAKNRNGPVGKFTLLWDAKSVRFTQPQRDRVPHWGPDQAA